MTNLLRPGVYIPYFERAKQLTDAFIKANDLGSDHAVTDERTRNMAEMMLAVICEGCSFLRSELTIEAENHLVTPQTDPFPEEYDMACGRFRGELLGFKMTRYYTYDYSKISFGLATIVAADTSLVHGIDVPSLVVTPLDGYSAFSLVQPEQLN